ncbi:malonic semialdehyde reductase [Pengzhenrongella frigida]|uniref:Malonic semialdehyde reductase n=1 Tax=Pengzhenrongella frigida TaxID=1259133 RepID=A0A4V1ZHI6_9MICO|nr:malonic semialdehyde reductase [Cellulomonas sp. HLT2-17]RYV52174.1 malonic semialdehyde reductase [Cellulomonas sp. HLT2-17]
MTTDTALSDLDFNPGELAVGPDVADLLFREAHTVSTFTDDAVSDEQIQAAYDLLRWGPTAMNTLPLRLLLVRTPEARASLAEHMSEGNRARVLAAPLTIVAAADTNFHEHLGVLVPHLPNARDMFAGDAAGREAMARSSALIQVGYLIVALRATGLHAGPMGGMDAAGIDADLLADSGWKSLLVINVGLPAGPESVRPRAPRLEFSQVARTL